MVQCGPVASQISICNLDGLSIRHTYLHGMPVVPRKMHGFECDATGFSFDFRVTPMEGIGVKA